MSYKKQIIVSASEDRLEGLILERLAPGANKEKIDQRIWDLFGEDWVVMFTDLSGFSRHVAKFGIIHFLQTISESQRILIPVLEDHEGILLKTEGDSFLVIFRNAKRALEAAIAMQKTVAGYNVDKPEEEKVLLCVGLGYGHMLRIGDQDVFGEEVNAASKLGEDISKKGEILLTEDFRNKVGEVDIQFEEIKDVPAGSNKAYRVKYQ
ncbi:MAG: adenylate/guanylate cyclase domain-containing protein [Candidatus Paceibacterota bacterium]